MLLNMEHSEYVKLQEQLQDHFDGRYVKIDDCEKTVEEFGKNLNHDYTEIAIVKTELKQIKWLLSATVSGIIAMLVKMFFGA